MRASRWWSCEERGRASLIQFEIFKNFDSFGWIAKGRAFRRALGVG